MRASFLALNGCCTSHGITQPCTAYYAERGLRPGAGHAVRLGVVTRADLNELVCTQVEQGFFSAEGCSLWTWAALGSSGSQQVLEEGPSVWQSWTNGLSNRLPPSHNISSWKKP